MYTSSGFHLNEDEVIRTVIEPHLPGIAGYYIAIDTGQFRVALHASLEQIRELHNSIGESLARLDSK